MKVVLEFDTNNEDESILHKTYIKAEDMVLAFWNFQQFLRSERKYPKETLSSETYKKICEIEDEYFRLINEYELSNIINQ